MQRYKTWKGGFVLLEDNEGRIVRYIDHAAEVERLTAERDAATARAERAEAAAVKVYNIVDKLRMSFESQRNVNFTGGAVVQEFIRAKEELSRALSEEASPPADASKMVGERERREPALAIAEAEA